MRAAIALAALCSACMQVRGAGQLPERMHNLAIASIENVYREQFKEAFGNARKMIKEYPDHPAGYFFAAAVLDAEMERSQSNKDEAEFYRYCDLAVSKGEMFLEKKDDRWVRFFTGGAHGARGTYESRYGRWITAFRYGWQGVTVFKELLDQAPEMKDAILGIATYDYWRSAMTKMLWWMPGVEDKRDQAIKDLYSVLSKGVYVRESAAKQLVPILNNEKRYSEARNLAKKMLKRYPNALVFHWGLAEALLGLGTLNEAEATLKYIQERIEAMQSDNNYNKVLCHYMLAKIYFEQQRLDLCVYECNTVGQFALDADTKKRLETQLQQTASFKKKARARARKKKQNLIKAGR